MSTSLDLAEVAQALPVQDQAGEPQGTSDSPWATAEATNYEVLTNTESRAAFDGSAAIYEFKEEYGDVGPKFEELEVELFGRPDERSGTGLDFANIAEIEVQQEGPVKIDAIGSFKTAGLHPVMLENVELAGYEYPTPIQKYTIPSILQGYDVIGIAQTGSGKTAAYLIPILSKLMGKAKKLAAYRPNPATFEYGRDEVKAEPLVLVVVPTRELAVQIFNEARKFAYRTMLRPCVVYGGLPIREQINLLSKGCDILIGTPGRLIDFIHRPDKLTLRRLKYIVIDEADEMLDDDWKQELEQILNGGEQDLGNIKFGLFSATFPKAARDLAKDHLAASHVRFRVGRAGSTTQNIKQRIIQIDRSEKRDVLISLLHDLPGVRTIIFVNSRFEADSLDDFLFNSKLPVTSIHGERTQIEREYAMRAFRSGNAPILVATGVSARGIDVRNVMHVINFNLPSIEHGGIEEYTHRIGRTGRIGHRGLATSFYTEHDEPLASVLTRTLLETEQEIPDFLEQYVPDGYVKGQANLKFETESDFDPNDLGSNEFGGGAESGGAGGWGGDADANAGADAFGAAEPSGDGAAWGAEPAAPTAPAGDSSDTWGANPSPAGHGGQNANPSTDNAGWGTSDGNTGGGGW
ncbi:hypothetical protein V2G26_016937 [Clonostachys chloroleuca]